MHAESLVHRVNRALGRNTEPPPAGLKTPPQLSGALPVIGHGVDFVRSALPLLHRAYQECGEVAGLRVLNRQMYALFGPEAHEAIFRAPDSQLNPQEAYQIMTPVFGKGMVYDAPPDKMNEQMKMLLPALKDKRMRSYGEVILGEVEQSIASWGDEGEFDLVDYCRVLTNFTSSACLLGPEFRSGMSEEFARVYHDLERGVTPLSYINKDLPLPSFRKRDKARARMVELITSIIAARRDSGRVGEDFLQTLMDAKYKSGAPLTEDEITGMLLAAMFAGHHTSSVTTAWTLLELIQNPACLDKVVDELDALLGEDGAVTYHSLRDMHETEYAVKEALRLHPPLFMLVRVVREPWTFKGYHFPVGSWLLISPTVSHQIPEVFAEPLRFDPQRYAPGREEDKRDYAFIAFGGGRHKCMGNAFALLQVKAILAVLLRRYHFSLSGDPIGSDFHGLVIGPQEPCRLRYRRRHVRPLAHAKPAAAAAAVAAAASPAAASPAASPAKANGSSPAPAPRPFEVSVDLDLCQGHAVCMGESPEIFKVSGVGKVRLLQATPPADLYAKAKAAEQYCPQRAIRVTDK
jgi:sterol 14-demethylase